MTRPVGFLTFTLFLAAALLLMPMQKVADAKATNGLTKSDYAKILAKKYSKNKYVPQNTTKMSSEDIYKKMLKAMKADGIRVFKPNKGKTPLTRMEFIDFTYSFFTHNKGENGMVRKYYLKERGIVDDADIGIIKSYEGEATFERHVTKKVVSITGHEPVLFRDIAETAEDSRMELQFDDQSVLTLGEETSLEVNEMIFDPKKKTRKTIVKVAYGKIRVKASELGAARNDLEIVTPTAVIGVRGTEFAVSVDKDGTTEVVTLSGLVAVKSGRDDKTEVLLKADMATKVASTGKISKPKKISSDEKKRVVRNTKVKNPKKVKGGGNVSTEEAKNSLENEGKSKKHKKSKKGEKGDDDDEDDDEKGKSSKKDDDDDEDDKDRGQSEDHAKSDDDEDDKDRGQSEDHASSDSDDDDDHDRGMSDTSRDDSADISDSDKNDDLVAVGDDDDDKVYTEVLETIESAGKNDVTRDDLWNTIQDALDSNDIRDRQGALEQIADAKAGRVLKDANGYWVRSQQYLLRPDENTAEIVAVNYRGSSAGDLSGLTVMDWTTTFNDPLPTGSLLRDLPWGDYLTTVDRGGSDPYVSNTSDYTLEDMTVEFRFGSDTLTEARTFGALLSNQQSIDSENLTVNTSQFTYNAVSGKNTYSIGSITGGFSYDMVAPTGESSIEVKTYVVGDATSSGNTGEVSGDDSLNITDLWTALAVNTSGGANIGENNLELTFSNGSDSSTDLLDGTIDLVYVPIPRMEILE